MLETLVTPVSILPDVLIAGIVDDDDDKLLDDDELLGDDELPDDALPEPDDCLLLNLDAEEEADDFDEFEESEEDCLDDVTESSDADISLEWSSSGLKA